VREIKLLKKTVDGRESANQKGAANARAGRKRVKPHDDDADGANDGDFDPSMFN
jgi:hypothetical protein